MKRRGMLALVIVITAVILISGVVGILLFSFNRETITTAQVFGVTFNDADREKAEALMYDAGDMTVYLERMGEEIPAELKLDERIVVIPSDVLKRATYNQEVVLWKGAYPARIKIGEDNIEAQVSCYAHFFGIEGLPGYFEVNEKDYGTWESLMGVYE